MDICYTQPQIQPKKSTFVPDPALKEAFEIFACGFKIGAIYGFALRKTKQTEKQVIAFLETLEANELIYSLLLKEGDFEKGETS